MSCFINFLESELETRKKKNPQYSLRAFAVSLDEGPAYLSKVLNRKIEISALKIYKYSVQLKISKEQTCTFLIYHLNQQFTGSSDE